MWQRKKALVFLVKMLAVGSYLRYAALLVERPLSVSGFSVHHRRLLSSARRIRGRVQPASDTTYDFHTDTRLHSTLPNQLSSTENNIVLPDHVTKWLDIELPEGRCVGVKVTGD